MNKKILIVDDNAVNRKYLRSVLKSFTLSEAENGQVALDMFETANPDLILMDIQMPIMDGMECMIQLRKTNTQKPIIAITAFSDEEDRNKFIEAGFNDFLAKPLPPNAIRNIVSHWLKDNSQTAHLNSSEELKPHEFDIQVINELKKYISTEEYESLVLDFIDETKIFLNDIELLTNQNDFSSIIRILHTIKGNAASLGFYRLSKLSAALEADLKNDLFQNFSDNFGVFKCSANDSFDAFKTQLNSKNGQRRL